MDIESSTMRAFPRDVINWDFTNWWRCVEFWQEHLPSDLTGTRSLDIGCGSGGISLWLAKKNSHVTCSDLTDPQERCEGLHRHWAVEDHIRYRTIDATHIQYESEFDIIAFKSILGGVGWNGATEKIQQAVQGMYRALKPGGKLLFAENLDTPFHRFFRTKFVSWGKSWNYLPADQILDMLSCFSSVQYASCGFFGALGRSPGQRTALGYLDKAFVDKLVPSRHHYILFGVAQK